MKKLVGINQKLVLGIVLWLLCLAFMLSVSISVNAQNFEIQNTETQFTDSSLYECADFPNFDTVAREGNFIEREVFSRFPVLSQFSRDFQQSVGNSAIVAITLSLSALPYLGLIATPGLFVSFLSFFFGRKSKNPWGLVLDSITQQPIQFAICRVYTSGTKNLIDQTLTDKEGSYGFSLPEGVYRFEIIKNDYETFVTKIVVDANSDRITKDVYLIPSRLKAKIKDTRSLWGDFKGTIKPFLRVLSVILFLIGFALATAAIITNLSTFNIVVISIYLVVIVGYFMAKSSGKDKYSTIIDSKTVLRIPNALVKIFSLDGELIDTKLTNNEGFFDYWGKPGEYFIHVSLRGYNFPSEIQTDLQRSYLGNTPVLKVGLKDGENRLRILIDPLA